MGDTRRPLSENQEVVLPAARFAGGLDLSTSRTVGNESAAEAALSVVFCQGSLD